MKHDRRGSWYLLTGAVLGIALGLFYSWIISPVKYIDAPPYALRADFKDEYRLLVASAFLYSNDLLRARDRLVQLKDEDPVEALKRQAQQALQEGRPEAEGQVLESLAEALSQEISPTLSSTGGTPISAVPTLAEPGEQAQAQQQADARIQATQDNRTALPGASFALQNLQLVCNQDQNVPLIQVEVNDAAGQPVPGVEVVVSWEGGEDHFYTGLQPQLGLGYGDFGMTPGVVYSIQVSEGEQPVNDITPAECVAGDDSRYWGSWFLIFVEP
ncbi:MAG: hypothetical protein C3F13_17100 [Anaerolineales bacterium]|nr:hypothetical protein [Anaerolineae bacterium]PWB50185.1 MAG: hypothetical protein C3F13_17100 [Anaerolineales bacterium]